MRNNNWYTQNPYGQSPYPYTNEPYCYGCPACQNNYDYYQPTYDDFYRTADEEDIIYDDYEEFHAAERDMKITNANIQNITAAVKKDSMNIFKDIEKFIKDTRLLDYLLAALITYICNNYYKYKDVIEEKTDDLIEDLRTDLPWVFDILKVFGITPAALDKFLDNLIKVTVANLKKLMPAGL
jgi:hypothetical protein